MQSEVSCKPTSSDTASAKNTSKPLFSGAFFISHHSLSTIPSTIRFLIDPVLFGLQLAILFFHF